MLPYYSLFVIALLYEYGKREATDNLIAMHYAILELMETYDEKRKAYAVPCTGDILCERTGVRHKSGCYATYGAGFVLGIQ